MVMLTKPTCVAGSCSLLKQDVWSAIDNGRKNADRSANYNSRQFLAIDTGLGLVPGLDEFTV